MKRLDILISAILIVLVVAGCKREGNEKKKTTVEVVAQPGKSPVLVDLTHPLSKESIAWPTAEPFKIDTAFYGKTPVGFFYAAFNYCTSEHCGTHIDAPIHFAEGKMTVDQLTPEQLIGDGIVIDVSQKCADNRDYLVTVEDFLAYEQKYGQIKPGTIVLLRTGFGKYYPDKVKYMGTDERGAGALPKLHFPGLDPKAAAWLVKERTIKAIGLDTPSIDFGQSTLFECHRTLFDANIPTFENVANLDRLPDNGFRIMALPVKIAGGSGAPLRIVAEIY